MHLIKRLAIALAACLAIGGGLAAAPDVVQPQPASAQIMFVKVSPTSERTIRVCDLWGGHGICKNVGAGHWSPIIVDSIQVDHGCELYIHGVRYAKRKNHDWWWNSVGSTATLPKATIALRHCR